jgi:hypothetical protein
MTAEVQAQWKQAQMLTQNANLASRGTRDMDAEGDDQDSSAVLISSSNFKFTAFPNLTSFTGIPWSVLRLVCVCVFVLVCVVCGGSEMGGLWHCARSNPQYAHVQHH